MCTLYLTEVCNCSSGSPRVEGDEEDDGIDDLDFEFDYRSGLASEQVSDTFSRRNSEFDLASAQHGSQIPLLTYGDEVCSLYSLVYSLLCFALHCLLNPHCPGSFLLLCRTLRYRLIDMLLLYLHHLVMSIGFINLLLLTLPVSFCFLISFYMFACGYSLT